MQTTNNLQGSNPSNLASLIGYNANKETCARAVNEAYQENDERAIEAFIKLLEAESQKHHDELGRHFGHFEKRRNFQGFDLTNPNSPAGHSERSVIPSSLQESLEEKYKPAIEAFENQLGSDMDSILQKALDENMEFLSNMEILSKPNSPAEHSAWPEMDSILHKALDELTASIPPQKIESRHLSDNALEALEDIAIRCSQLPHGDRIGEAIRKHGSPALSYTMDVSSRYCTIAEKGGKAWYADKKNDPDSHGWYDIMISDSGQLALTNGEKTIDIDSEVVRHLSPNPDTSVALKVVIDEYLENYGKSFNLNISTLDLGGLLGTQQMDRPDVLGPKDAEDIHAVFGENSDTVKLLLLKNPSLDPQVVLGILDTIADAVANDEGVLSLLEKASENPNADVDLQRTSENPNADTIYKYPERERERERAEIDLAFNLLSKRGPGM